MRPVLGDAQQQIGGLGRAGGAEREERALADTDLCVVEQGEQCVDRQEMGGVAEGTEEVVLVLVGPLVVDRVGSVTLAEQGHLPKWSGAGILGHGPTSCSGRWF